MARIVLTEKDSKGRTKILKGKAKQYAKKTVDEEKKKKNIFRMQDAYNLMTPAMAEVMKHPAANIWMITGKDYGKGYSTGLKMIAYMETDLRANGFALKKYKTNAGNKLHHTFENIALELKLKGFSVPSYEKGQNKTYRMRNRQKTNNQSIEYASFEDYNSITGTEAFNLGFFPMVIFDEPSQKDDDPSKTPTKEVWDSNVKAMKSSISRSNRRHKVQFRRKIPYTQYYYTLNPWDDHPIILEAQQHFPEEQFFEFVKKDLLNNHTAYVYVEEIDTLIVRGTKFGNPIINAMEEILLLNGINNLVKLESMKTSLVLNTIGAVQYGIDYDSLYDHLKDNTNRSIIFQAQKAIQENNAMGLAEILGLKYVPESKYKKVYNLDNLQIGNTDEILKNMDKCSRQIIGWDIDQRKDGKFVMTPVWVAYKIVDGKWYKNIIIGRQIQIMSKGMGSNGQHIMRYFERKQEMTEKVNEVYMHFSMPKGNVRQALVTVDDNSKHFIRLFSENIPYLQFTSTKFKNQDNWKIIKRQNWLQTAIDFGYIIMDEQNLGLIKDLKKAVSKEGHKQRDESGAKAKDYDRINSMEYALYYLRGEIAQDYLPGTMEMYKEKGEKNE